MDTYQDKHAQIQAVLREGLLVLSEAAENDRRLAGVALLSIHAAMEDFLRLEIARKVPDLRAEVEDVNQTGLKSLSDYSRMYLGFGSSDVDMILTANSQRNSFAHSKRYGWSWRRADVARYAAFVYGKCNPGKPLPDFTYKNPAPTTSAPSHASPDTPAPSPTTVPPEPRSPVPPVPPIRYRKPWYRSTVFLFLFFFLFPPLWAFLIVTDRNQGCLAKIVAYTMIITILLGCFWLSYNDSWRPSLQSIIDGFDFPSIAAPIGPRKEKSSPYPTSPSITDDAIPRAGTMTGTETGCIIVWVEHTSEQLAAKNRSMVWEEIVMDKVRGSGMTDRQFYDQVVEKNSILKMDGYEFKKGKSYLLPECQ
jgi:hypothetical protein